MIILSDTEDIVLREWHKMQICIFQNSSIGKCQLTQILIMKWKNIYRDPFIQKNVFHNIKD